MAIFDVPLERLRRRTSMKWTRFPADVLPMWVAEMDVDLAPGVRSALTTAVADGDFGYIGGDGLQRAFTDFAADLWGWELEPRQLMLCADVVTGMTELVSRLTAPEDSVVINPPIYPPFRVAGGVGGRRLVEVAMTPEGRLDLPALERAFRGDGGNRPAAYLLCSPHNPAGTVHTRAELTEVARLATKYGVRVISDEIHAPLITPGVTHTPYLTVPGSEDAYVVTSASKSFNLAALKAGLLIAGTAAQEEMWRLPYEVRAGASHLGVIAQAAGLDHDRSWLEQASREIAEHKELLSRLLEEQVPRLSYRPTEGTYLAWVDCTALGLKDPAAQFRAVGKVAFNPGSDYSGLHRQWIRLNLATSPELIAEGVARMAASLRA